MANVSKTLGRTALSMAVAAAFAAPAIGAEEKIMPRVDVIGSPEKLERLPGSAEIIDKDTLEGSHVFTTSEALRKVPGVHVRDEEGFGLRPNIGIRGLNPTRSTKLTLLEDGIPLSYAPYGDNASYYHPPIDRFERIEVLKGAGQNLFGPQTIGGVINYITPAPPKKFGGSVSLTAGNRDYFNGHASLGGDNMLLDFTRKQGDGARDNVHSELNDLNFKKVAAVGDNQALTLRANYYSEDSTVTYSGLTDAEYRNLGPRYNPFKNDRFQADRYGASATHEYDFGGGAVLTTNLYAALFSRDWWRQSSTTTDSQYGGAFTAARSAGTAVNPDTCNSIQGRLRDYTLWGVEPRLHLTHSVFGVVSELDAGVRAHFETQNRIQVNATSPTARTGAIAEDNERKTQAYSAFAQNRFLLGRWTVTPGLRFESIDSERTNRLTGATGADSLGEWIPSLGATFSPVQQVTVFAGVHKGFAPPRTEDVISSTGTSTDVGPEKSWNYELGMRAEGKGAQVQATLFRNDFARQIAVGSIAGGSTPLAEGKTLYQGLELSGRIDGDKLLNTAGNPYLQAALTLLPTARQATPFSQVVGGTAVTGSAVGNRLPYAPERQLTATVGYAHPSGLDARLEAVHVSAQFSDFANTEAASATGNGQVGKLAAYTIWNAALNYRMQPLRTTLFLTVKNLANKTYIADRTRGILPGSPRLIQAGMKYDF